MLFNKKALPEKILLFYNSTKAHLIHTESNDLQEMHHQDQMGCGAGKFNPDMTHLYVGQVPCDISFETKVTCMQYIEKSSIKASNYLFSRDMCLSSFIPLMSNCIKFLTIPFSENVQHVVFPESVQSGYSMYERVERKNQILPQEKVFQGK